jgi:hypothetical protein
MTQQLCDFAGFDGFDGYSIDHRWARKIDHDIFSGIARVTRARMQYSRRTMELITKAHQ